MSTKASLHYPWQDVLSVWPCTHCMSFYKCWPLLGVNQCCSLFNTSTPVYLTQLVAVHFNATAQYIYQPAGDDVELRASAKLKLFSPPFPSLGWYTEKSLSARFINAKTFTEIWADTKVKLQGKFKRQDPGCAASLPMFSDLSILILFISSLCICRCARCTPADTNFLRATARLPCERKRRRGGEKCEVHASLTRQCDRTEK